MDLITAYFRDLAATPFNTSLRISLFYLCCTVVLAYGIWMWRGRPTGFAAWLLPARVYRHRSNLLDIKLFLTNRFVDVAGLTGVVFFPPLVAFWLIGLWSDFADYVVPPQTWGRTLAATVIIVMASDFCKYWAHRWHHEWRVLWPFHAVHHSADVLTPLTVMRAHPVESLVRNLLITVVVGAVQALVLVLVLGKIDFITIGGANALYVLFNTLGANLRHSHIWLSYGRVMEHVFISPAQHQVHHSVAIEHHDKNYGSIFALWDWAFGTLYIPPRQETLTFGVSDGAGNRIAQPHGTLRAALFKPFVESVTTLRFAGRAAEGTPPQAEPSSPAAPTSVAMTLGFSLWLDVLRVGAALTVLLGHMAHVRFTGGDWSVLREWNVASDAVIVFFVLSGVVIAYAADRDGSLGRFAFRRVTRIVPVVVPALLLTIAFDALGRSLDPSAYQSPFYEALPLADMLGRGLSFTSEWQGLWDRVRLGSNGPLWSLSYEVAFYMMFAVTVFLGGALRAVLLALIMVLVGVPILALLPCWALGVLLWRHLGTLPVLSRSGAWSLAAAGALVPVALKLVGLPEMLSAATEAAFVPGSHHAALGYSDEMVWNTLLAVGVAVHLWGVHALATHGALGVPDRIARAVRWVAGGSFSLYVLHYPTLHLLDASLPENLPGHALILLGGTLVISYGFAALFERRVAQQRALIRNLWRGRSARRVQGAS